MIKTLFTRKTFIAISLSVMYAVLLVFTCACIDGAHTFFPKKNLVNMLAVGMRFEEIAGGTAGFVMVMLLAVFVTIAAVAICFERQFAIFKKQSPASGKMFAWYFGTAFAAIALSLVTLFSVTACTASGDVESVKKNKKIVVGVTDYAPFDYKDGNTWIGFDADMARLVATDLGVDVEFQLIEWDKKIIELKSGKIDLIWNGMTKTDELAKEMDFSYSYATNSQIAVIKNTNARKYTNAETMKDAKIVVESKSAGETAAVETFGEKNVTALTSQVRALMEVMSGTADVAIVDFSMASSLCGKGSYKDLIMVEAVKIGEEEFAVGARKGSDLVEKVNAVLVKAYKDGTMKTYREKYGKNADGSNSIALCDLSAK